MRAAVIGAGMTGLVAGFRLAEAGHDVDVYERWPGLGGQVATLDVGDGLIERYYHHLFTSDVHIAGLYEELGLEDGIEWLPSSVAIFTQSKSWPFTTPLDLLRFRPMSLRARIRMGLAVVRLQRRAKEVEPFESITAHEWIDRHMGREAWEMVWGPLLRGKFGNRDEDISMAWLWSKLTLRRQVKGKEARKEVLGYPRGSWQPLLERLQAEIELRGGRVLIDRPVAALGGGANERFMLRWGQRDSFRQGLDPRSFPKGGEAAYDAVVATVPNDIFSALLATPLREGMGEEYRSRLDSISYHAARCMVLELDRQFTPFYWTNVADLELPFVGLVEQTNLVPAERYGGRRFLYIANYLAPGEELLELTPDELLSRYEPGLRKVNPEFSREWIRERWVFTEPHAQPIVVRNYRDRMPPIRTPVERLYLANTTQVYPEDRGTNYAVRLGDQVAEAVLTD
jgi:protoporphyrinogen oxidase